MNSTQVPDASLVTARMTSQSGHTRCQLFDVIVETLLMGSLCAVGFVGNALSFVVLRRHKSKSPTPTLFMALAAVDTLFLLTVLVLRVLPSVMIYTGWHAPLDAAYAYVATYTWPAAMTAEMAAIWMTVLVTINRYVSVCRPLQAATLCSKRNAYRHLAAVAVVAVLYNLPRFFEYRVVSKTYPSPAYNASGAATGNVSRRVLGSEFTALGRDRVYRILYANILYFLLIFIIPLLILVIFNTKLIVLLRRSRRERGELLATGGGGGGSSGGATGGVDSSKQEHDITVMLIGVVLVFLVCKTPALLTHVLLSALGRPQTSCPHFYFFYSRVSDALVVTNSATNFIVYCFCSRKFRHILSQVVCRRGRRTIATENGSKTFSTYTQVHDISTDSQSSRRAKSRLREKGF